MAAVDCVLAADVHVEILTTNGSAATSAIDLTGNALAQEIVGNAGANVLNDGGKGAADTLRGWAATMFTASIIPATSSSKPRRRARRTRS